MSKHVPRLSIALVTPTGKLAQCHGCDGCFCKQAAQAAFVMGAEGFSPTAHALAVELKPSARRTKPCGLKQRVGLSVTPQCHRRNAFAWSHRLARQMMCDQIGEA
jgi:hypothetical protein